jgi:hypothetical protein
VSLDIAVGGVPSVAAEAKNLRRDGAEATEWRRTRTPILIDGGHRDHWIGRPVRLSEYFEDFNWQP